MYQDFKDALLSEMEMERDIIVMNCSQPDIESLFAVNNADDELYSLILKRFNWIAYKGSTELLFRLFMKYGKDVKKIGVLGPFQLSVVLNGVETYISLKGSLKDDRIDLLSRHIINCDKPVYIIWLVKDSLSSKYELERIQQKMQIIGQNNEKKLNLCVFLFEDFLREQFGTNELMLFKRAMLTFNDEIHHVMGYQITEILNSHNLNKLKEDVENEILNFHYAQIKNELYAKISTDDTSFQDLNDVNFARIKDKFLCQDRYKLLFGGSDFSKSFLTSEWIYKKYFSIPEMDNTFIVAGYLKSIEQLLWDIILIIGKGRRIRGETIDEQNINDIDKTLGSLQYFITNYENDDLFESYFESNTHFIMRYLKKQISNWRSKFRNGYFHKDNLLDVERIEEIRATTIFLYMLILGSLSLNDDVIILLS